MSGILRVTDQLTPADLIAVVADAPERLVLVDVDGVRVVLEIYPTAPTALDEFMDDAQLGGG